MIHSAKKLQRAGFAFNRNCDLRQNNIILQPQEWKVTEVRAMRLAGR
jgi:hypothetical protein